MLWAPDADALVPVDLMSPHLVCPGMLKGPRRNLDTAGDVDELQGQFVVAAGGMTFPYKCRRPGVSSRPGAEFRGTRHVTPATGIAAAEGVWEPVSESGSQSRQLSPLSDPAVTVE
ncbi:hypothetical protein GCM10010346_52780 [Streptomyces chryseus]|uniref:Uncharacterized protein n=1 Tax=Streptomyces chryseus TaxID=68186 RepID=A0ABQ3E0X5_9ACTN|nr:hypothetical protein GCM10010346_52780 [Streptomyces chryseus]